MNSSVMLLLILLLLKSYHLLRTGELDKLFMRTQHVSKNSARGTVATAVESGIIRNFKMNAIVT